ncbi:MAG: NADH-quinone oxidoreductase subunit M [Lapillicoccus sp.]
MALTLALLVPGLAAVWLLGVARTVRAETPGATHTVALVASVVTLGLAVVTTWARPTVDVAWVPSLGVRWHFAVDGISIPLVLLTAALTVLVVVHAGGREPGRDVVGSTSASTFYACILFVELGALAAFLTRDAVVFFVAFEIVLVPMWVLIGRFGDEHARDTVRRDAASRFVFFTVLGSTLMLLGILVLVTSAGTADLDTLATAAGQGLSRGTQTLAASLLVVGLGIKVPLFPVHTWLPPAHTVAPTAGSVLLAAVLLKMGTYGIVRLVVPTVPLGFAAVSPWLAAVGAVGILWGGLACLVERDLKRLVAYSSVAHMGFVAIGLASGTSTGIQAALFANVAHGLVSALLFLVVGGLKERWGGADLTVARQALRDAAPRMGWAMVVGFAAALGLPGLVGFWGEFLAVYAAWSPAADRPLGLLRTCAVVAVVGMALAAGYSLRVLRLVWAGGAAQPADGGHDPATLTLTPQPSTALAPTPITSTTLTSTTLAPTHDASGREWAVILVLVVAVVLGGILPGPLLAVTAPDATRITQVGGRG